MRKKFRKKSLSAKKIERGDLLVSPGMVCYTGKQEKPFWFSSLGQMVQFGAILFCRTFKNYSGQFVWIKKSHYNSRVSLHEATTKKSHYNSRVSLHEAATKKIEKREKIILKIIHLSALPHFCKYWQRNETIDVWKKTSGADFYHAKIIKLLGCISPNSNAKSY